MGRSEYFKLPERLAFPNQAFQGITGEWSTLHALILLPETRDGKYRKRRPGSHWLSEDKANFVKIFDDPTITGSVKTHIAAAAGISMGGN